MKLDEKKILSILPIKEELRKKLLDEYDTYSEVQRVSLSKILWDTYNSLYEIKLQENLDEAFLKAQNNKETLDPDFYARVHKKTEDSMTKESLETSEGNELEQIRSKLQIMAEGT